MYISNTTTGTLVNLISSFQDTHVEDIGDSELHP